MSKARTRGASAQRSGARALIFGIIFTVAVFFAMAFIGAIILSRTENPTAHVGICSMAVLFITAATAGLAISKYKGEGGVLVAVLSSLFFTIVVLMIGLIGGDGKLPLVNVINLGAFMLISVIGALIGRKRERKRRRK